MAANSGKVICTVQPRRLAELKSWNLLRTQFDLYVFAQRHSTGTKPYAKQKKRELMLGPSVTQLRSTPGHHFIDVMRRRCGNATAKYQVNVRHLRDYGCCLPPEDVYQFGCPHRTAQRSPLARPMRAVPRFARGPGGRVECLSRIVGDRIVRHLDRHARCPLGKPLTCNGFAPVT